ncbi:MAG: hypothetical protein ONB55_22365 [candidate division KSB1 bacterium]|nr:hypothetical protein [candidate division KSB1 bacterium]
MNVLEIVQRFCVATGLPSPSVAVLNPSEDVRQIVELLNQEGRALSKRHDWQALTFEATFTTVAAESQGTLSSIIGSSQELEKIVNDTIWNRTARVPIYGPVSRQTWQAYKALTVTGPYSQFRIRKNELLFDPAPTAGQSCYFEYVSRMWCTNSAGTTYRRNVADDTDLVLLDDELILAGLEWRWLRKKGLNYAEEFASYEALVSSRIASDGMRRTLNMDGGPEDYRPGIFVPIGSWNL